MTAFSVRQAGRIAVGAISFLALGAACAEGTNSSEPDPLPDGMAGATATGGMGDGTTAGTSSAGQTAIPTAGKSNTGTAGKGGMAASGGMGGTTAMAGGGAGGASGGTGGKGGAGGAGGKGGAGGAGGAGGKAGSGGGGTGGAGGMGGGGMAGSGGSGTTGSRYAKLVATSELTGNVWSSVAELQVLTTGNIAISRTGWVVTADSQELDDQNAPATAAIDGDNATFWHTEWEPAPGNVNDAKLPHSLIVDMTSAHTVVGFSYLPRQSSQNGRIKDWQFFLSKDGTNWGTAVKIGTFAAGTALQTITF